MYHFLSQGVAIPQGVAGILLSAILSDTLNFKSPTTTPYDERAVAILESIALPHRGVTDLNQLCGMQFKAKCFVIDGSAHEIINGDRKQFTVANAQAVGGETSFAWGTAEVFPSGEKGGKGDVFAHAFARADELMYELRAKAKEEGKLGFFSLVDGTLGYDTALFCAGEREKVLAERAFGDNAFVRSATKGAWKPIGADVVFKPFEEGYIARIGKNVSRKLNFIPPIQTACKAGGADGGGFAWGAVTSSYSLLSFAPGAIEAACKGACCVKYRIGSPYWEHNRESLSELVAEIAASGGVAQV